MMILELLTYLESIGKVCVFVGSSKLLEIFCYILRLNYANAKEHKILVK